MLSKFASKYLKLTNAVLVFIAATAMFLVFYWSLQAYNGVWPPTSWPPSRQNFLLGALGSFVGSIPILAIGYVSWQKVFSRLVKQEEVTEKTVVREMTNDLSTRQVFIRLGHFSTSNDQYRRLVSSAHGKEGIWDYHIHVVRKGSPSDDFLRDFFVQKGALENSQLTTAPESSSGGEQQHFNALEVFNCQLYAVVPDDAQGSAYEMYTENLLKGFRLAGYSDIVLTCFYSQNSEEDKFVQLTKLTEHGLNVRHVAVFYEESNEVKVIEPDQYPVLLNVIKDVVKKIPSDFEFTFQGKRIAEAKPDGYDLSALISRINGLKSAIRAPRDNGNIRRLSEGQKS